MTTPPKSATTKTLPPRRRMFAPAVEANEHGAVISPPASLGAGSTEAHTADPVPSKPARKPRKSGQSVIDHGTTVTAAIIAPDIPEEAYLLRVAAPYEHATLTVFDTPEPRTYIDPASVVATPVRIDVIADIMSETAAVPQSNIQTADDALSATDAPADPETPVLAYARKPRKRRDTAREDAIDVKIATRRLSEMETDRQGKLALLGDVATQLKRGAVGNEGHIDRWVRENAQALRHPILKRYGMRPALSYIGRPYGKR